MDDGGTLAVDGFRAEFSIRRMHRDGRERWSFLARDRASYVRSDYYSYRLSADRVYVILGDAPECVPIDPGKPMFVRPNPADYRLGIIDLESGACRVFPLDHAAHRADCRIEAVHDSRILISCDGTILTEYEVVAS